MSGWSFWATPCWALVTADYLFRQHPDLPEGDLTRIRAALVCEESLHEVAQSLDLGELSEAGQGRGGRRRPAAGVHSGGRHGVRFCRRVSGRRRWRRPVRSFTGSCWIRSGKTDVEERRRDYKTELQELVQRRSNQTLQYELVSASGPDHAKVFTSRVLLNGQPIGKGQGHSKKEAEQAAAHAGLATLIRG